MCEILTNLNRMEPYPDNDTLVFPRRKNPTYTEVRHNIGRVILSKYENPKPEEILTDSDIMQMITETGQNPDHIIRMVCHTK